ncbi:hypothetical protein BTA51_10030 [Hahella sp. CCB-MM4]|uniref:TonB-dependent receptor plug domain-containing protein n=1 Tax=Hahella sp. (strain CCB-MM4) TaxID=1926491 RepID=UPI000B9A6D64|nr:TonB-dependent receptor plug domain-containing protein [Hahella sp. CCB-MM4]OZG73362.1 hypothetical protein BTA51_10030 [Hahella sp. CCB-MM4]
MRYEKFVRPGVIGLLVLVSGNLYADETANLLAFEQDAFGYSGTIESEDIPVVLTPARLKQPRSEVPATVTIITDTMLKDYGIRNLHDAFRLVPGMTVGSVSSSVPTVSYHGTNASEQRRLQVLVDGRSVYHPNLANVDWLNIPVALEDIARIEISRGPNAAAYGANSFLAIINIITKHPYDTHGSTVSYWDGSNGYNRYYGAYGNGNEKFNYRLSVNGKKGNGFDKRADGSPFLDSHDLDGFNFFGNVMLSPSDHLNFQLGLLNGDHQYHPNEGDGQVTVPTSDERDRYASIKWQREVSQDHFFHVQGYIQKNIRRQDWINCNHPILFSNNLTQLASRNPRYNSIMIGALVDGDSDFFNTILTAVMKGESTGLGSLEDDMLAAAAIQEAIDYGGDAEVCGRINLDIEETRTDLEFQDTYRFNDEFRLVSGLSLRKDQYTSQTYFGGSGENYLKRLFFNLEYQQPLSWGLNIGAMAEDDNANGAYLSPRAAAYYHIDEHQTLRAVISHAIRTPDTYEQYVSWSFTATELDPPLNGQTTATTFTTQSPGGLDNEKIVSREIGYYVNYPRLGWEADIKIYDDDMWDLISAPLQYFSFEPENNLHIEQRGVELETSITPIPSDTVRLTYAYMDQDAEYTGTADFLSDYTSFTVSRLYDIESRLSAQNSGSLAWVHRFTTNFRTTLLYYVADQLAEYDYQRYDAVLSYERTFRGVEMDLTVKLEHYPNSDPFMYSNNNLDDRNHLYVGVGMKF